MPHWLHLVAHGAVMAAGMAWQTGWSLVLGFAISAALQTFVSTEDIKTRFGRGGAKDVALAAAAGAASSSCSYASAAIMRTLFKKGAALETALAFLFASTNLVLELGIILLLLLGWQFMLGEWVGGVVLVVILALLVRATCPRGLIEAARTHEEAGKGHEHMAMTAPGARLRDRLAAPDAFILVAQNFAMEWRMLWKDLLAGFLIGGFISALVPHALWQGLFLAGKPAAVAIPADAFIGPLVAVFTFVCSIGNVPLAAVLFAGGASFGGVLAFLYADLIVLPLLDAYRRYFGWRMAAYFAAVFYVTMVAAALIVTLAFAALGLTPAAHPDVVGKITHFAFNYTFWLNVGFGVLAVVLLAVARRHPMQHGPAHHHGHHASA